MKLRKDGKPDLRGVGANKRTPGPLKDGGLFVCSHAGIFWNGNKQAWRRSLRKRRTLTHDS